MPVADALNPGLLAVAVAPVTGHRDHAEVHDPGRRRGTWAGIARAHVEVHISCGRDAVHSRHGGTVRVGVTERNGRVSG